MAEHGEYLVPLRPIREVIEAGGPADETEARRLALAATSRITDSDLQHDLRDRLLMDLAAFELEKIVSDGTFEMARQMALETLAEIEAASWPN